MIKSNNRYLSELASVINPDTGNMQIENGAFFQQLVSEQDLSVGSLSYTTDVGKNFIVKGIYLIADSEITQTVKLTYNDVDLLSKELTFTTAKIGEEFTAFAESGEELTITCTNTGTPAVTLKVVMDIEVI